MTPEQLAKLQEQKVFGTDSDDTTLAGNIRANTQNSSGSLSQRALKNQQFNDPFGSIGMTNEEIESEQAESTLDLQPGFVSQDGIINKFAGPKPRMHAKERSLSVLTDDDLSSLAEANIFPNALKRGKYAERSQQMFEDAQNIDEKKQLLKELLEFEKQEISKQESIDNLITPTTVGLAGTVAAVPLAFGSVALMKAAAVKSGVAGLAKALKTYGAGTAMNVGGAVASRPMTSVAAGIVAKKAYDTMGGDAGEIEKLPDEKVAQVIEQTIESEKKENPELFESRGFDVPAEDYTKTKAGTSEVEMTPEMIERDRVALLVSMGASEKEAKEIAADDDRFEAMSIPSPKTKQPSVSSRRQTLNAIDFMTFTE